MPRWFNALTTDIIVDTPRIINGVPVKMAARRYVLNGSSQSAAGLTLLCLHSIGSHKELWEPILENVFQSQETSHEKLPRIREIWSLDCPDHGDSALLNASIEWPKESQFSLAWAEAVAYFRQTHLNGHRVVVISNSGAAYASVGSIRFLDHWPTVPYEAFILIEPPVVPPERTEEDAQAWRERTVLTSKAAMSRRDVWDSHQGALKYFTKRFPWNEWDDCMVHLYVENGLRPISDRDTRLTLKCPKAKEAESYSVPNHIIDEAMAEIEKLCDKVPVHVLFGEYDDFMPEIGKTHIRDMARAGRIASVMFVSGVGHFVCELPAQFDSPEASYIHVSCTGRSTETDRRFPVVEDHSGAAPPSHFQRSVGKPNLIVEVSCYARRAIVMWHV
ncbi:hypothetical protein NM688_g4227 [Phlebia brevispora]|uniref:Uncharacterized protein n=1 Tax=Phlebia brevispora TaxID=194682 RepID=A0ACC1T3K7_9APHY|nr:hypothetical protein NM688_g4227 [Phlebia brevispora]